jgi:hypothetical protein
MDGFAKKATDFETFLIGQLGRDDSVSSAELPGSEILEVAISFVKKAQKYVGGRIIMIDCENNEKVIQFYRDNEFIIIQKHDKKDNLMQMIKVI